MGVAREERRLICEAFEDLGPDAPTLCEGWTARDLAAHLVVRERRADAAPGIMIKALAAHTQRVQDAYAAKPWPQLVDMVRTGPPSLSPFAIPGFDELANTVELFVHHEDLRRAQPDWEPRGPEPVRDGALWRMLARSAKLTFRNSPVGVVLRRGDGSEIVAKRGPNTVTLAGEPGELALYAAGREQVRIEFDGEQRAVAVVQGLNRGI